MFIVSVLASALPIRPPSDCLVDSLVVGPKVSTQISSISSTLQYPRDSQVADTSSQVSEAGQGEQFGWQAGPLPIPSQGQGMNLRFAVEQSSFDVDTSRPTESATAIKSGEVELTKSWAAFGCEYRMVQLEAQIGLLALEQDIDGVDGLGFPILPADGDGGYFVGGRAIVPLAAYGRWQLGGDVALSGNTVDVTQNNRETTNTWLELDLRTAVGYSPRSESLFALAPFAGAGFRFLDGIQSTEGVTGASEAEFDAQLLYGFVGTAVLWRPREQVQCGIELQMQFGDVEGAVVGLTAGF